MLDACGLGRTRLVSYMLNCRKAKQYRSSHTSEQIGSVFNLSLVLFLSVCQYVTTTWT